MNQRLPETKTRDLYRLTALRRIGEKLSNSPLGDTIIAAVKIFDEIEDPEVIHLAELAMIKLRKLAAKAEPTTTLFVDPPKLNRKLTADEFLQLFRIEMAVHELCYACEMVQHAAEVTWGGSTGTRFYLNSIYYYTSSLFLIDTSKRTHKNLSMGGTVIRALVPMGLGWLLDPIKELLSESFGEINLGQAILNLRHSDLVHGDFSLERVEYLVRQTQMRNPNNMERFAHLIWRLFHRVIILDLRLLSLLASSGMDPGVVMQQYIKKIQH